MQRPVNLCDSCAHRHKGGYAPVEGRPSCNAFLEGIPSDIWDGKDHRAPVEGDGGVQYLMAPGNEDILATYLDRKESESDVASALGD